MKFFKLSLATLAAAVSMTAAASAAAIITNGTITLGVDDEGQLNIPGPPSPTAGTPFVGLRHNVTGNEATSHGCLCEGWGVGIGETLESGFADNSAGITNITAVSFASTASTATSVASMNGKLEVTHEFAPSTNANLYEVKVTIKNTSGADIADLRYTRGMDWDIEPTAFSEFTTIAGTAVASAVLLASASEPFGVPDPFGGRFGPTGDFVDAGPTDNGAMFDFGFGALKNDESLTFSIFYGAASNENLSINALAAVGAEVYSLGQANCGGAPCDETFIFGFKGVGGDPVSPVPLPAGVWLMMTGLGLLGAMRAKRRALAA